MAQLNFTDAELAHIASEAESIDFRALNDKYPPDDATNNILCVLANGVAVNLGLGAVPVAYLLIWSNMHSVYSLGKRDGYLEAKLEGKDHATDIQADPD